MDNEQDYRLGILNSLLSSPHREVDAIFNFHKDVREQDPLFYEHLAAWYNKTGDIRDHQQVFITNLCISDFDTHREVGLALLRELPPFQLTRVVDLVIAKKKNVPRSMRTEITRYLKEREQDVEWFDNAAVTARKHLKRLYALLHISPNERAQSILFDDNPPEDSLPYKLKQVAKTVEPTEQARLLNEYKIPYRIAQSVIKQMTPSVLAVLIDSMSAQELINNMGSLNKRGAMDNAEIKTMIEAKLKQAKTSKKVSALKGMEAVKAAGLSEELNTQLKDIVDTQVKSKGRIKRNTLLLVDKSGSMSMAIETAKQIATLVSAVMDADFYVYAYDNIPYEIRTPNDNSYAGWESAFRGIHAGGGTTPSAGVLQAMKNGARFEQVIHITDEGEGPMGSYSSALKTYETQIGIKPYTVIVRIGNYTAMTQDLRKKGFEVDEYQIEGQDYYSLPNLIHFLTKPNRLELLMDIMAFPLPTRKINVINNN